MATAAGRTGAAEATATGAATAVGDTATHTLRAENTALNDKNSRSYGESGTL